jgi:hypothetical protein
MVDLASRARAASMATALCTAHLAPATAAFYRAVVDILSRSGARFLIGGAYALGHYTGIARHTKDFDVFVLPEDVDRILSTLAEAGYCTDLTFPHWLGKIHQDDAFVDIIFSSGNGIARVDETWFRHAAEGEILGRELRLCPAEEIIWSKAFIIERERYDGADIAHLVRARGRELDWQRLLARFDRHWRVLFSHLVLFGYVYPGERDTVPAWVMRELLGRLQAELSAPNGSEDQRVCQGTLLSRAQYLVDIRSWGYEDARLHDDVHMNEGDIAHWTAAIDQEPGHHVDRKDFAHDRGGR